MLERLGYRADVASSGQAALDAVANKEYDLIFMDLHMPGMGGIETTRRIGGIVAGKRAPYIVAMTASVFEEDRLACLDAGMRDFMAKPIDIAQLEAVFARVAKERSLLAPSMTTVTLLDNGSVEKLRQLELLGGPGFVASLCRDFIKETPQRLARMRQALDQGDVKEIEREAHGLKSVSASLGAAEMSNLCAQIEEATHQAQIEGLAESIATLAAKFAHFERALTQELRNLPPPSAMAEG